MSTEVSFYKRLRCEGQDTSRNASSTVRYTSLSSCAPNFLKRGSGEQVMDINMTSVCEKEALIQ